MLDFGIFLEREMLDRVRYVLPALGIVLVMAYALMGKHKLPAMRGVVASVLVASVGLGFVFYTASHWRNGTFLNGYEFFHYYLGAKYAPELGYTGLYAASWEAQRENGDARLPTVIRNLKTEGMMRPSADAPEIKEARAAFTPARWEAFKADVAFLKFSDWKLWNRMHKDKGFNATPPWTLVAMPIASAATIKRDETIRWLPWLDVLFILAAMACVTYAFGPRAMLLLMLFLTRHYLLSHFTLKSAFLRVDLRIRFLLLKLRGHSKWKTQHFAISLR